MEEDFSSIEKIIEVNGKRVAYTDTLDLVEEAVICLHGFGESKEMYQSLADFLSPRFRTICVDLPGHGNTEEIDNMTLEGYVDFLKSFLTVLGLQKIHLIGYSIGGSTSMMFDILYPDYAKKIIAWEAPADYQNMSQYGYIQKVFKYFIDNPKVLDKSRPFLERKASIGLMNKIQPGWGDAIIRGNTRALMKIGYDIVRRDFRNLLTRITKDVMVLYGVLPDILAHKSKMEEMREYLPNATFCEVRGAQHLGRDRSKAYEVILSFLK